MPRPLLPPRGVIVPTEIMFGMNLSPQVRDTWVLLRALAWGRQETPRLSLRQLTELTGKEQSTLYGHMAHLRDRGALRWRPAGEGTLIVSFPDFASSEADASQNSNILENASAPSVEFSVDPTLNSNVSERSYSETLEKPSLNDSPDTNIDIEKELKREAPFQNPGIACTGEAFSKQSPLQDTQHLENASPQPDTGAPVRAGLRPTPIESPSPLDLYRTLSGLTPNKAQRLLIQDEVSDPALWRLSLEHWLGHGWNPRNVNGMLDLYGRGGAAGCRHCAKGSKPVAAGGSQTRAAIAQLRKEYTRGKSG